MDNQQLYVVYPKEGEELTIMDTESGVIVEHGGRSQVLHHEGNQQQQQLQQQQLQQQQQQQHHPQQQPPPPPPPPQQQQQQQQHHHHQQQQQQQQLGQQQAQVVYQPSQQLVYAQQPKQHLVFSAHQQQQQIPQQQPQQIVIATQPGQVRPGGQPVYIQQQQPVIHHPPQIIQPQRAQILQQHLQQQQQPGTHQIIAQGQLIRTHYITPEQQKQLQEQQQIQQQLRQQQLHQQQQQQLKLQQQQQQQQQLHLQQQQQGGLVVPGSVSGGQQQQVQHLQQQSIVVSGTGPGGLVPQTILRPPMRPQQQLIGGSPLQPQVNSILASQQRNQTPQHQQLAAVQQQQQQPQQPPPPPPPPTQQQQQQQQQQQHKQPQVSSGSYQQSYLKQLENKTIGGPQKPPTIGPQKPQTAIIRKNAAQQRARLSKQLDIQNQQQKLQQPSQPHQSMVDGMNQHGSGILQAHQQRLMQQSVQPHQVGPPTSQPLPDTSNSPNKKLSLTQYRQRLQLSNELKQQQGNRSVNQQSAITKSIPVSVNNSSKQQYYFVQRTDGSRVLAVLPMGQNPSTIASSSAAAESTTTTNSNMGPQLSLSNSHPVQNVRHEELAASSSSSSSSSNNNNNDEDDDKNSSASVQEGTVNSTTESDKDPTDEPKFMPGRVAVCIHCGILSEDLNRCQRCKTRLPNSVRTLPAASATTNKTVNMGVGRGVSANLLTKQDFYGKAGVNKKPQEKKSPGLPSQKGKGRGRGRGKAYDEPVIIALSSDEEDDNDKSAVSQASSSTFGSGINGSQNNNSQLIGPIEPINRKEPVITADMENYEDCEEETGDGFPDFKNLAEKILNGPYKSIPCRSVRIGSYKIVPTEKVIFLREGIRIKIPSISEDEKNMVTIDIPVQKIVKILAHFGKSLPVFFVYVKPSLGSTIRNALKMTDPSGFYFDPCSLEESQKRITILPDIIEDDSKTVFKELFKSESNSTTVGASSTMGLINRNLPGQPQDKLASTSTSQCFLEELEQKEANEILVRSAPPEVQNTIKKERALNEVNTLLIYPPAPQKGGISVTTDDYACLEEEQFLNDVIIDFYLKWLLQSKLSEIHRQRTHVFSTFFYKRLTSKPKKGRRPHAIEDDPKLTAAEKRHARVKSWTKSVDIFSKDYIIVPINEHAHWFLAIICYPGLDGPVRMSDNTPVSREALIKPERRRSTRPKNRIEIPIIDDGEWSDRDEAEGDDEELEDDDDEDEPQPPVKKLKTEGNSAPSPTPSTAATISTTADDSSAQTSDQSTSAADSSAPAAGVSIPVTGKMENDKGNLAVRQPCILIFDSLSGANRSRIVATLRDYLAVEHKTRKKVDKPFTRDTMKGACPRVPQQMNYSDCGIFTLQFAESFFEHPLKDYTFPIRTLAEWFAQEVVQGKREAIAKLIKSLMEEHNPNHASIELPDISFASQQDDKALKDSAAPTADQTNNSKGNSVSNSAIAKILAETSDSEKTENDKISNIKEENTDDPVTPSVDTVNSSVATQPSQNTTAKKDGGVLPIVNFSPQEKLNLTSSKVVTHQVRNSSISTNQTNARIANNLILNNTKPKDGPLVRIQPNQHSGGTQVHVIDGPSNVKVKTSENNEVSNTEPSKSVKTNSIVSETLVSACDSSGLDLLQSSYDEGVSDEESCDNAEQVILDNVKGTEANSNQLTGMKQTGATRVNTMKISLNGKGQMIPRGGSSQMMYVMPTTPGGEITSKLQGRQQTMVRNQAPIAVSGGDITKVQGRQQNIVRNQAPVAVSTFTPSLSYESKSNPSSSLSQSTVSTTNRVVSSPSRGVSSVKVPSSIVNTNRTGSNNHPTHTRVLPNTSTLSSGEASSSVGTQNKISNNPASGNTQSGPVRVNSPIVSPQKVGINQVGMPMSIAARRNSGPVKIPISVNQPSSEGTCGQVNTYRNSSGDTELVDDDGEVLFIMHQQEKNSTQSRQQIKSYQSPANSRTSNERNFINIEQGSSGQQHFIPESQQDNEFSPAGGTPSCFKFSERGTSSGRSIAPPKRYLDGEPDASAFIGKRPRGRGFQGKSRGAIR